MPAVRMSTGSTSTTLSIVGTPSRIVANRTSNIMASKTSTNLLSLETTQAIQTSSYSEILVVEKSGKSKLMIFYLRKDSLFEEMQKKMSKKTVHLYI